MSTHEPTPGDLPEPEINTPESENQIGIEIPTEKEFIDTFRSVNGSFQSQVEAIRVNEELSAIDKLKFIGQFSIASNRAINSYVKYIDSLPQNATSIQEERKHRALEEDLKKLALEIAIKLAQEQS